MLSKAMGTYFAVCILILASTCMIAVKSLEYADLDALGINCPADVSCVAMNPNGGRRNCECDRDCVIYNDCCFDARIRSSSRNRRSSPYICMQYGDFPRMGAYVVQTCSRNFVGPADMQRKCQNQNNISDPFMATPVTDLTTRRTYRNRYCAECNNADPSNLQSWSIQMACDLPSSPNVTNEFIWQNIQYRPHLNKWGVETNGIFHVCEVRFEIQDYLSNSIRNCIPNLVSSCPEGFNRIRVKNDCASYTAVMFITNSDIVYRNPHCALCNNVTADRLNCDLGVTARKKKPFSFALLLDVNQSDGEIVGVSRPSGRNCGENQKYDPYFKKCRDLVCALPGYKMVNGKCKRP